MVLNAVGAFGSTSIALEHSSCARAFSVKSDNTATHAARGSVSSPVNMQSFFVRVIPCPILEALPTEHTILIEIESVTQECKRSARLCRDFTHSPRKRRGDQAKSSEEILTGRKKALISGSQRPISPKNSSAVPDNMRARSVSEMPFIARISVPGTRSPSGNG